MDNLRDWILEAANGEEIEGVVIGEMGWGDYGSDKVQCYNEQPRNKLISWSEAEPFLNYEFNSGYGAPGCNAVNVWTKSRVIFISQYDGATSIEWIPRNPCDCEPSMPGS